MGIQLDHAFIACRQGAPEADALLQLGFVEGSPNTHPGQGTSNRRFFFDNFMLELLWLSDQSEASSAQTRRTRLWERCSSQEPGLSPFGILFRPDGQSSTPPFPTWAYLPSYLPAGLAIDVAEGTTLQEPELFYLSFLNGRKSTVEPTKHKLPFQRVSYAAVGVKNLATLSDAALAVNRQGQLRYFASDQPILELHFEGAITPDLDLRPALPLVFRSG